MPEIVVLEGDRFRRTVNLRRLMKPKDYNWWKNATHISDDDIRYLNAEYPELLGVWGTVAAGAGKVIGGIFRRIAQRVRERRAARAAAPSSSAGLQPEETQRFYRTSNIPAQQSASTLTPQQRAAIQADARILAQKMSPQDILKSEGNSMVLPIAIGAGAIAIMLMMRK